MEEGKGFNGSQYVQNTRNYRTYYSIRGERVYIYPFEKDVKLKKYFPYAPGQKIISLKEFKGLLEVRDIKKIRWNILYGVRANMVHG